MLTRARKANLHAYERRKIYERGLYSGHNLVKKQGYTAKMYKSRRTSVFYVSNIFGVDSSGQGLSSS